MTESSAEKSKEYLWNTFSEANFARQADVSLDIAVKIVDQIKENDGRPITILLPSRGANIHLISALRVLRDNPDLDEDHYASKIDLPPLECFDSIREDLGGGNQESRIRILILPFTADAKEPAPGKTGEPDTAAQMRESMAKFAYNLLFKSPSERNSSPAFLLYLSFLEEVEGRGDLADYYRTFMPVQKGDTVLMIDTAISGRASYNIFEAFNAIGVKVGVNDGVDLKPILLVDNNGERLNKVFRKWVDMLSGNTYFMNKLMAEDKGAAVLGVVSVIYQNLIEESGKHTECGGSVACFGSWNEVPERIREPYMRAFSLFADLIALKAHGEDEEFRVKREEFIGLLIKHSLLENNPGKVHPSEIGEFVRNQDMIASATETRSHIIVVNLKNPEDVMVNICKRAKAQMKK